MYISNMHGANKIPVLCCLPNKIELSLTVNRSRCFLILRNCCIAVGGCVNGGCLATCPIKIVTFLDGKALVSVCL